MELWSFFPHCKLYAAERFRKISIKIKRRRGRGRVKKKGTKNILNFFFLKWNFSCFSTQKNERRPEAKMKSLEVIFSTYSDFCGIVRRLKVEKVDKAEVERTETVEFYFQLKNGKMLKFLRYEITHRI